MILPDEVFPYYTDARAVVQPQPAPLGLLLGHFQPFPAPDALDSLMVHLPPVPLQQGSNAPVAMPATLRRQADDALGQTFFRFRGLRSIALAGAGLTERPAHRPGVLREARRSETAKVWSKCCTACRRLAGLVNFPRPSPATWHCQRQICHYPLQPGVLLLQGLQALRLVRSQAAILLPPPVVGVVTNPQTPANLANCLPTCPAF
jgi:hypothetical protein